MNIKTRYGLPFVEAELLHNGKRLSFDNFLIDTGSASTLIAAEIAVLLGLGPDPHDPIREIRGIGGTEFVYEKRIGKIRLESKYMENFKIQIGDMEYGFEMNGIIGYDFLKASKAVIDLDKMAIV